MSNQSSNNKNSFKNLDFYLKNGLNLLMIGVSTILVFRNTFIFLIKFGSVYEQQSGNYYSVLNYGEYIEIRITSMISVSELEGENILADLYI